MSWSAPFLGSSIHRHGMVIVVGIICMLTALLF
jgi:hypothetical protein